MSHNVATLPPALGKRLSAELQPGESLAWVGQPNPGRMMRLGFLAWLFFVPWLAFACFWFVQAGGLRLLDGWHGAVSVFPLFGLPFVLIGLGGLSIPFWVRRKAAFTVYAVTNRRALEISGVRSVTVRSWRPSQLRELVRTERPDGSGDLMLSMAIGTDSDGDRVARKSGFYEIPNVREVERKVAALAATPAAGASV